MGKSRASLVWLFATITIALPLTTWGQATVRFQWDSLVVAENDGPIQIPIELQGGQPGITYTVSVASTIGGTATQGIDYQWTNTTRQLSVGQPIAWVTLTPLADNTPEPTEEIRLSMASIVGGASVVGLNPLRVWLTDATPCYLRFTRPDSHWVESDGLVHIPLMLSSGHPYQTLRWKVVVENGTAYEGLDFELMEDTLTVEPGFGTLDFKILLLDNAVSQNTRWARLHLVPFGGSAALAFPNVFTIYLQDDDYTPSARMADSLVTCFEAIRRVPFRISLDVPPVQPLVVYWHTEDGTALAGTDYVAHSDSMIFLPGQTEAWDSVSILNDTEMEADEMFLVRISGTGVGGLVATPDRMYIRITDNDPVTVGSLHNAITQAVEVYPNPFQETITIRGLKAQTLQAQLVNAIGDVVASQTLMPSEVGIAQWHLPALVPGVYYLVVSQAGVNQHLPLVRVP
jgi:hypothetical protein